MSKFWGAVHGGVTLRNLWLFSAQTCVGGVTLRWRSYACSVSAGYSTFTRNSALPGTE